VAVLDKQKDPSTLGVYRMLYVDGGWLQAEGYDAMSVGEIKDAVSKRAPVITFGGDINFLYDMANAAMRDKPSVPVVAQGLYFDGKKNHFLFLVGTYTTEAAATAAYNWANGELQSPQGSSSAGVTTSSSTVSVQSIPAPGFYEFQDITYYFSMYPYGQLNIVMHWYKLQYDQVNPYDWYSVVMTTQSVPGIVGYAVNGSNWRTSDIWNYAICNYTSSNYDYPSNNPSLLISYGPYSTNNVNSVSYSMGVNAGSEGAGVSCSVSETYSISNIEISDLSNFGQQLASWWHNVDESQVTSTSTIDPGAVIRTPSSGVDVLTYFAVKYGEPDPTWGWLGVWDYSSTYYFTDEVYGRYNWAPDTPSTPAGPGSGVKSVSYTYSTATNDADCDNVNYWFYWGDGTYTWTGWHASGATATASHSWSSGGVYSVQVAAEDYYGTYSSWSQILPVYISPTLTISVPNGGGTTSPSPGTYTYTYGSSVTVTATASSGYYFNHWSLDGTAVTANPYTLTMAADHTLAAYFSYNPTLTISVSGSGTTSPSPGTYTYSYGAQVQVTATPSSGYYFAEWSVDGGASWSYSNPITITMTASHSLMAYFYSNGGGGGGCPILYTYDGKNYMWEGLLNIHNADGIDVTTNHTLTTYPGQVDGAYQFTLIEHPETISHIDQVKLYAVLQNGKTVTLPLIYAWHSDYGNVLPQLLFDDGWKTVEYGANWNNGVSQSIQLKFLALPPNVEVKAFIFQITGCNMILKD
jgi:hypothetical protein